MAKIKSDLWRIIAFKGAIIGFTLLLFGVSFRTPVNALTLQNRSVTISSSVPSANTSENIKFTYPSTDVVGSIVFQYCDNSALISLSCNAPPGFDSTAANLAGQSGNTGFSIYGAGTNGNTITLTRAASAGIITASSYNINNIVNPSDSNHSVYIRISLYSSVDGSGSYNDNGSVAFSTTQPVSVNVQVPPFLDMCVAITVSTDCSSSSGSSLNLGTLQTSATKFGTSQFSVGTNSITGFVAYVFGTTMTSGNNTIPALNPAATSKTGSSQFGLNLRANTTPSVGQDPSGGTGAPLAGYNTPNFYKLNSGDAIASSNLPTNYSHMTVSYITNINGSQTPGVYTTTFTYMAVAQF